MNIYIADKADISCDWIHKQIYALYIGHFYGRAREQILAADLALYPVGGRIPKYLILKAPDHPAKQLYTAIALNKMYGVNL